jgi:hemerythrin-like domain-containing protein
MNHSSATLRNVTDLTKQHHHINKLFSAHQKLLMHGDINQAFDVLIDLKKYVSNHMKAENDYLLPLYKKYISPIPIGGAVEFFTHEHNKIDRSLEKFAGKSSKLIRTTNGSELDIVRLFDQYYIFKQLLDHHHTREDTILFRSLDKVLDEIEKKEIMMHFSF